MHAAARHSRAFAAAAAATMTATLISLPTAADAVAEGDPSVVGRMSGLFEELPDQPFCEAGEDEDGDGFVTCKPTSVSSTVMRDGTLVYWNGIENTEGNVDTVVLFEAGKVLRDSRVRTLDLRGAAPRFGFDLGRGVSGDNPAGEYETPAAENPLGVIGTGKPGDGPVGSTIGRVVQTDASAPTEDSLDNDADMFCSDLAILPDGRIIVAGGTDFYHTGGQTPEDTPGIENMGFAEVEGVKTTWLYDRLSREWTESDAMEYGRWYPTLTTMPSGDTLAVSGVTRLVFDSQLGQVRVPELYDAGTEEWTTLYGAGLASENSLPLYPRVHVGPSGDLFYAAAGQLNGFGPTGYAVDQALWGLYQFFDVETQAWEIAGATQWAGLARGGAFSTPLLMQAPYDTMDIVVGGGTLGSTPGSMVALSLSEVVTIDDENTVTSVATEPMDNPRWFSSGTLLPDGSVLASGGGTLDHVNASGYEGPVAELELFDPVSQTWSPAANLQRDRIYHNTATLLQDGRVLIGGHSPIMLNVATSHQDFGGAMANNRKDPSFEIYSPPYLFRGERPTIVSSPALLEYGENFSVQAQGDIRNFSLIRTPSVSHTVDADQRGLTLDVLGQSGSNVSVDFSKVTANAAPPGEYYLFANTMTPDGLVPSVAAIVTVADDTVDAFSAPGSLVSIAELRDSRSIPNNGMDSAAAAQNGGAQEYVEGNIMEGIMTRQYPAPGLEDILEEMFEEATAGELRVLLDGYSPMGFRELLDALQPLGLANRIEGMVNDDPILARTLLDTYDQYDDEGTAAFQQGLREMGAAQSTVASTAAQGAFQYDGPAYSGLSAVPVGDEGIVRLGGDEDGEAPGPPDEERGFFARMWQGFLDWFR